MNAIGGYFELELGTGVEYHSTAIRLNTARNAFEYILRARNISMVYLPYYCCDALLKPLNELGIHFGFYAIDEQLEPVFDFSSMHASDYFLYINYFGVKSKAVNELVDRGINLIVDNAQALYEQPLSEVDTFYSPRKYFGVPDGAYLYSTKRISKELEQDQSFDRIQHLMLRRDKSAEEGFDAYKQNEQLLNSLPLKEMSQLSRQLLNSIDYKKAQDKRLENYRWLGEKLRSFNPAHFELQEGQVPMVYPFLTDNPGLREKFQLNRIYVAQYWPEVLARTKPGSIEYSYTQYLLPLPIDQRYGFSDLDRIIKCIE